MPSCALHSGLKWRRNEEECKTEKLDRNEIQPNLERGAKHLVTERDSTCRAVITAELLPNENSPKRSQKRRHDGKPLPDMLMS